MTEPAHPAPDVRAVARDVIHSLRSPLALVIGHADRLRQQAADAGLAGVEADLRLIVERAHRMLDLVNEVGESRTEDEIRKSIGHKLRAPLSIVIGYSEYLLREGQSQASASFHADLELILHRAKDMVEFLNGLIDLFRDGKSPPRLEVEEFDLRELLEARLAGLSHVIRMNKNEFTFAPAGPLGMIRSDPARLWRVLRNLLSNASKFSREGRVTLSAVRHQGPADDRVTLTVADTGVGLAPEHVAMIQEQFDRLDATMVKGYSVGLATCALYAGWLGAILEVRSIQGQGAEFAIKVPSVLRADVRTETARIAAGRGKTLLICDDDTADVQLTERALRPLGWRVVAVPDSADCVEVARREQPAAILLDVFMPKVSGWDVLTRLKKDQATARIPIIMATISDDWEEGLRRGADGFLVKPINYERLCAVLGGPQ
jgi:signal transduction histidine kinase